MTALAVTSANSNSLVNSRKATFRSDVPYYSAIGSCFSVSGITYPCIEPLTATRIVVANDSANTLTTYDFNGSSWSQVGNAKSITLSFPSITVLSATRICFLNATGSTLQAYDFNETDWTAVGSAFTLTSITGLSGITTLSSTVIALADSTNDKLVTYTFNGSTWSQTGNALTITGLGSCNITSLTSIRVAVAHNSTSQIRAYDWNGTNWSQVGSASSASLTAPSISKISSTQILVSQYGTSEQYQYSFNGSSWTLDFTLTIPVGATSYTSISFLEAGKLVFTEENTDTIQTYSFGKAGIPYVLSFYGTTVQVSKGNLPTPTSWTNYTVTTAATTLSSVNGAMDSTGILHVCWMEEIGASSDLVYRTFNCNTNAWVLNTIVNADIGSAPYYSYLFTSITVDSANKPHIAYLAYPSISGGATYALWYINKVAVNWSSNVQVQHVKNRNCSTPEIVIDLDGIPVISVTSNVAANGTTVYRGNLNVATSFSEYIINSTTVHHHTGICIAPNGDCYVISFDAVNFVTVLSVWKHAYAAAWGTWTSLDFTFPNSAGRNTLPSLFWYGRKLYLFLEDHYDHDIKFASYDGSSWSSLVTLETGTFNSVLVNNSFLNNFQKDNTETLLQECTGTLSTFESFDQMGQTFEGADCRISKVTFLTSRPATVITGKLYARLYEVASLTTAPSGIPIAISNDSSDVSTWTTTATERTWKFNDVQIESGKYYAVMLHVPGLGGNQRLNIHYGYQYNPLNGHMVADVSTYNTHDANIKLYQKPESKEIDYVFMDETATPDVWWNILSLAPLTTWVVKSLKWYNGSSWIAKPLKHYNGSSWATKSLKQNL